MQGLPGSQSLKNMIANFNSFQKKRNSLKPSHNIKDSVRLLINKLSDQVRIEPFQISYFSCTRRNL